MAANGMMIDLSGNAPKVAEYVETGRIYLDGSVQIGALDGVVRDRIRMALNGHVIVDRDHRRRRRRAAGRALVRDHGPARDRAQPTRRWSMCWRRIWASSWAAPTARRWPTMTSWKRRVRRIVRKTAQDEIGKKPEVTVVVSRLS